MCLKPYQERMGTGGRNLKKEAQVVLKMKQRKHFKETVTGCARYIYMEEVNGARPKRNVLKEKKSWTSRRT